MAGPLDGLRVVEFDAIGPGPMAATLLADLGADVVRVDRVAPSGLGIALAPEHEVHGRSRRSVAIDLARPAGRSAALRLLDRADVAIEGLRPGVMERLGLGPAAVHARNPALVYGRVTGYGQTGPLAHEAGHDLNYIALTGVLDAIGAPGGPPLPPLNLVGDYGGGALFLAFGVLAALHERTRSGRGQVVDAAMVDGASALAGLFHGLRAAGAWHAGRGGNLLDGGAPYYAAYETADGRFLSIAAIEPKFFSRLVDALGLDPGWVGRRDDRRQWPALRDAIATAVRSRTLADWRHRLDGSDACTAPVLRFDEAPAHRHAVERGGYVSLGGVVQPAPAPRFDRTPAGTPRPAPRAGQHTRQVLAEAGLDAGTIDAMLADGSALDAGAAPTPSARPPAAGAA